MKSRMKFSSEFFLAQHDALLHRVTGDRYLQSGGPMPFSSEARCQRARSAICRRTSDAVLFTSRLIFFRAGSPINTFLRLKDIPPAPSGQMSLFFHHLREADRLSSPFVNTSRIFQPSLSSSVYFYHLFYQHLCKQSHLPSKLVRRALT